jgi:Uncharacterized conserved protein
MIDKEKTIISCAVTGAVAPRSINPHVPVTPEEIAACVYDVWKAGAAIVHLHMRKQDDIEVGTMDVELFRETIRLIRNYKDCDVIINCTSSGDLSYDEEIRYKPFTMIPEIEIGSYDIGTFNWNDMFVFTNSPSFLHKLHEVYDENDVKPEIEIFSYNMLKNAEMYLNAGRLKAPLFCQFMLGVGGMMEANVENLFYLVNHLPEGSIWSCSGIGTAHVPMMYAALAMGGNIRVGLEDNLYYSKGVVASNTMLVERAVRLVTEFGKRPAKPAEVREMLGIKPLVR